jgi:predicted AlkP superfamily phosphohydrolase/phosphomutase
MPAKPKILFIGLDAMDPDLIHQWAASGDLPTFASLIERGIGAPTTNPPGLYVGAVWPSFFTGTSPTRHGRYCFKQLVPHTYSVEPFRTSNLRRQPFWKLLSDAGKQVAVVDVPKSPLASQLKGIHVQDWTTHDPDSFDGPHSWPPDLAAEIVQKWGGDSVRNCNAIERSAEGFNKFARDLAARIKIKTEFCRETMHAQNWDLFLVVFAESHCVGHQCWTLHDKTHKSHDAELAKIVGDPLKEIYIALDKAVGELLAEVGEEGSVFVFTSHGMGPHYDATFMLDEILVRLDPRPGAWLRRWQREYSRYKRGVQKRLLRRALPPAPPMISHRRFFAVPNNDAHGAIRVNLIGREPKGKVRPGAEFEAVYQELREGLMAIINRDNNQPIVRDVVRAEDWYPGENLDDLPDFFIDWNRSEPIERVASPQIGEFEKAFNGVRTGDHKPAGFFWAAGAHVPRSANSEATNQKVSVMDFAPTLAEMLDVSDGDFDGRPIRAVLPSSKL